MSMPEMHNVCFILWPFGSWNSWSFDFQDLFWKENVDIWAIGSVIEFP